MSTVLVVRAEQALTRLEESASPRPWLVSGVRKECTCKRPERHGEILDGRYLRRIANAFGNPKAADDMRLAVALRNVAPEIAALVEAAREVASHGRVGAALAELDRVFANCAEAATGPGASADLEGGSEHP